MKAIVENINESSSFDKRFEINQIKKNSSLPSLKSFQNKNLPNTSSKNDISNSSNNNEFFKNSYYQNANKSLNNFVYTIFSKDKNAKISLSEKILLDFFINISEFNETNFDFYVSYNNLCKTLKNVGLVDTGLFNNKVMITKNDLDIILKEIQFNKNSSKKLNYKEFLRFLAYLTYKIDPLHFIDKPKQTLNFFINKYFYNYFGNNKNNLISLIYNYILIIQEEENINKILNEIIPLLNMVYTSFFLNKNEECKDNQNINNMNDKDYDKINFKIIIQIMKHLGLYPILVNIKKLVVMFYILLDDNNDNQYLNINDINIDNMFTFKKFCQFFLTLCLFIKENNFIVLKQYSNLLYKQKNDANLDEDIELDKKERIILFILNLKIDNRKQSNYNLRIKNKEEVRFNFNNLNLNDNEMNFLRQIFESYSSYFDKYLNYQISFSDILNFLKDYNLLLIKNNIFNNYDNKNILNEKVIKAQVCSRNKITKLKESLHSLDYTLKHYKNNKSKISNDNTSPNQINLVDAEILFSKIQQQEKTNISKSVEKIFSIKKNKYNTNNKRDYHLKFRLNLKSFIYFLSLLSKKLYFESFSSFIKYLSYEERNFNIYKLNNRNMSLKYLYDKYKILDSSDLIDIIKEFSPIIHLYFIAYIRKLNKDEIDYNAYLKMFSDFEIFPIIVNNNILKNVFYILYHIRQKEIINNEENKEDYLDDKNKKIGFDEFMYSFGIICLYLTEVSQLNEIRSLLALFYLIVKSDKIKNVLKNIYFNFVDILKDKITEISKKYNNTEEEEPEYIKFLKEPYL